MHRRNPMRVRRWPSSSSDTRRAAPLWTSDGTATGTYRVRDIDPHCGSRRARWAAGRQLGVALGDTLYFMANDGSTGYELWKSDGTLKGTVEVADSRQEPRREW